MKRRNHLGIVLRRRITHTDLTGWCFRCTDFYVSCFPHLDNKISLFPCFAFFRQADPKQNKLVQRQLLAGAMSLELLEPPDTSQDVQTEVRSQPAKVPRGKRRNGDYFHLLSSVSGRRSVSHSILFSTFELLQKL